MRLRKVISGGQTGADRTGLECAMAAGLETGGTVPKGYRTEVGPDPTLKGFNLTESQYSDYRPRTRDNVRDAHVTIWFGKTGSPGYWCTYHATRDMNKPFEINPDADRIRQLADTYEIWNIAGNRKSKNPAVVQLVRDAFAVVQELHNA